MKDNVKKYIVEANAVNDSKTAIIKKMAYENAMDVLKSLNTSINGLPNEEAVEKSRDVYGNNKIIHGRKKSVFDRIIKAFINPFTAILFAIAVVSFIMDIISAKSGEVNHIGVIIILAMVAISGFMRFIEETRSGNAAERLSNMVKVTTAVERVGKGINEILLADVVVGDIVHLAAGDMVPAEMRIIKSKDLFVSQSSLTGESEPVEKVSDIMTSDDYASVTEYNNIAFMGSNVISGSATCVVIATGNNTLLGSIAKTLTVKPVQTSFEKGVNSVSFVLIRFMLIMVPAVLLINGFTKGDWLQALLFAVSVAVGLTPEMLPMIVTTCLAKGAVEMSKKKTIIKNLNAIQNLGAIDILCTDKTGTITQDRVILERHMDIHGDEDISVLSYAFLNSFYQTGLKNLMDISVIERTEKESSFEDSLKGLSTDFKKVDEIPFDFERRRMSVVVSDKKDEILMITKGAAEEMISISKFTEYKGSVTLLTPEVKADIISTVRRLNDDGMRVIAVAIKRDIIKKLEFSIDDEKDMILLGYLAFLDPPKDTASKAIKALKGYGVSVKILTGDNDHVTMSICRQVGLNDDKLLLGADIDNMSEKEIEESVENINIFAKLSPRQKSIIVSSLRKKGHAVGYMGDGINDASAMRSSDIGISVDTAVDIAKESADVVLLEKDLMVLCDGIIDGRKTYANMIKYIKMTASSNFGNMFSVLIASAFLPFLPMAAIQILLLNFVYDISCTSIPWDNVDKEFLYKPRKWDAFSISKFMLWIGPTSSIFDIMTYLFMYFIICPYVFGGTFHTLDTVKQLQFISLFQSGWFIESMWSQTFVIHMIRTSKIPFIQSRASFPVFLITFTSIFIMTCIPFTPLGKAINLTALPPIYFLWLTITVISYMILVTFVKKAYIKRYSEFL